MVSPLKLNEYDIIICGGGLAGCVLVRRLSENSGLNILMLEAGENANDDFRISTPGLFNMVMDNPERDWQFMAEPSPGLNGRKMAWPRGKCIGGSSAINLMAMQYPTKASIDSWAELGNPGWDWDSLAPYYRKSQRLCPPSKDVEESLNIDFLDPKVQGTDGPICASYPGGLDPIQKAWVDTWKGLGKTITGDPLHGIHTGGFTSPSSVDPEKGERSHAGNEYYQPVTERENLHVVTGAMIEKIELDASIPDDAVATGVTFTHTGQRFTAKARREVILSAGTVGSSTLLELSGIGNKSVLEPLGINAIIGNPNVGENLQDHLMCSSSFEVRDDVVTADRMRDPAAIQKAMEQYQTSKSGPLAGGGGYSYAYTALTDFLPLSPKEDLGKLVDQYFSPNSSDTKVTVESHHATYMRRTLTSPTESSATMCLLNIQFGGHQLYPKDIFGISEPENYVTLTTTIGHSFSRGSIHISSADSNVHPTIRPEYFSHPLDVEVMARHLQQMEIVARSEPFASLLKPRGRRLPEGHDASTLERARSFARHSAASMYHQVGTCAMMSKGLGGVVDARLKVYGTRNLRVCDASVFPMEIRGNIMASVYAVAEKGSDIFKEDLAKAQE